MVYPLDEKKCLSGNWPVKESIKKARQTHPDSNLTKLADRLIKGAERFDMLMLEMVPLNERLKKEGILRDYNRPPYVNMVKGAAYADDDENPLGPGEQWNSPSTRRATLSGEFFGMDRNGKPTNPYIKTGIRGPGVLGRIGPNIAVDNGIIILKEDEKGEMAAYAHGVIRRDNGKPAFAGGFAKMEQDGHGAWVFDQTTDHTTRTEEFFEEMVSGSIELLPEYKKQMNSKLTGNAATEQEVALKMKQVKELDPGFWERLFNFIGSAKICYQGPVLCSNRNTDNSWIETSLGWYVMDDETWERIKGEDKNGFGYDFVAGDDAADIMLRKIDGDLLEDASGSHGPLFAYMSASFILDSQMRGLELERSVVKQFENLADFFDRLPRPKTNVSFVQTQKPVSY